MNDMYRNALDDESFEKLVGNEDIKKTGQKFVELAADLKYTYAFSWLGRPFIQFPQDIIALQEIIWTIKPDLIVETGIAHGGGLVFICVDA